MVSAILAIIIVNILYWIYMKIMGANVMIINKKAKIGLYVFVGLILYSILGI